MGATSEPLVGQLGKPALDEVEPRAVGGSEMQMETWVTDEPLLDLGRLMGCVVVDDEVHVEILGHLPIDQVQKRPELDSPVLVGHVGDDLPRHDVQSREEVGGPVTDVVVGLALRQSWPKRKHRCGPVECLDRGLLVHAEHERSFGWIDVKPHNITDFLHELRIRRELERLDQMRLESERPPDPADGRLTHARFLSHRTRRPVRGILRRLLQRLHDDRLDRVITDLARGARAGVVVEAIEPMRHEPIPPLAHGVTTDTKASANFDVVAPFGARQHDATSRGQSLRTLRATRPTFEGLALLVAQYESDWLRSLRSHRCLPSSSITMGTREPRGKFLRRTRTYDSGH